MKAAGDPAVAFLERLLSLSERAPDRIRPASVTPNYDLLPTAESIGRFQERMSAAERAGAVEIKRGRRERKHLIERVRVKDPLALARHLGRAPATETARELSQRLAPVAAEGEAWVGALLDELVAKWARGETAYRLAPTAIEGAQEFIRLLVSISNEQARGLDARTFSVKVTGDSKAFDRNAIRIATVLSTHWGEPRLHPDAVWARIGLERFSHPVHMSGPVLVEDHQGVLVHGRAKPFISIHPEMVEALRLLNQPSALLTIENYTSFNRQVREIDDGTLVVYTGGFAATGAIAVLRRLLDLLGTTVPFFHWGDIDPGGIQIFRFLEEELPRAPHPHLMTKELADTHGKAAPRDPTLAALANGSSAVVNLAKWMAFGEKIRHLEQEALDPRPVLLKI